MKRKKRPIIAVVLCLLIAVVSAAAVYFVDQGKEPTLPVNANETGQRMLIVGGQSFGVKFYTQGVMVVDMTTFETNSGMINPAERAGVKIGDIILSINNMIVSTNKDISEIVSESEGATLRLEISRDGKTHYIEVAPVKSKAQGEYKLGLWVRDSTAGIGTVTYIDPITARFGALGHGISDVDTGSLMPLSSGEVLAAHIHSVVAGRRGVPGQLKGSFIDETPFGTLTRNTNQGIFGTTQSNLLLSGQAYPIAAKNEVHTGPATIRCTVNGTEVKEYAVSIESINAGNSDVKNFVVRITDEDLLAVTGGIVQGMSGSPIIQDGKLIGALTHVLVSEPTMGYGIYIENMLASDN